jgi:riboflavin kinase/FMN adenylyltransferase
MRILRGLESLPDPSLRGAAVTWGVFDGVHRGHRHVLRTLTAWAAERRSPAAVITFDRHPAEVLRDAEVPLLCPLEERLELLGGCGVDAALVLSFTRAFAETPPAAFVDEIVVKRAGAGAILLGHDSHFGKDRTGDFATLRDVAARLGVEVRSCDPELAGGRPISSSLIRAAVAAGRLEEATELLGRPFSLHGVVVAGEGRGRTIGVPTANLELRHKVRPPRGVYAVVVAIDGRRIAGVANLGTRPTFHAGGAETVEVHLLDWSGAPLYGRELGVMFVARLRDEKKFPGVEELTRQIRADIERGRDVLKPWVSSTTIS